MLPFSFRFRLRENSDAFFANARGFRQKHITLLAKKIEISNITCAFSIKKKLGNAVVRALARRRVRHAFMELMKENPTWKTLSYECLVIIYPSLQKYETYKNELEVALQQLADW